MKFLIATNILFENEPDVPGLPLQQILIKTEE